MRKLKVSYVLGFSALCLLSTCILLPNAAGHAQELPADVPTYNKAIFQKPIPPDQLAFLNQSSGMAAEDLLRDKQFRKLMKSVIPDCLFHYGHDMPLSDALESVLKDSPLPVQIRDGRYLMISGPARPYTGGRGFIWIDMQDGIALGGFYFHPTNGEPTPSVTVFSRQVKEDSLSMSQLPPAFRDDFIQWATESSVPPVTTRYFIGSPNKKILLEHDENYCAHADGTIDPPDSGCEQMNLNAADIDMNTAYYLDQTGHATNATARMIVGQDQIAWLQIRDNTCGHGPNPLGCRIHMTREHTHTIIMRSPMHGSGHR